MRHLIYTAFILGLALPATAQETPPRGVWGTVSGIGSADLAIRGWALAGSTGMAAGDSTGILVTFWRAPDGTLARCVFSLVSETGTQPFETCSVAQPVPEAQE